MALIKTKEDIAVMREAGVKLGHVLALLKPMIKEGVKEKDLDAMAGALIEKEGATPAFLGYRPTGAKRPYPAVSCISLNDTVVHGVPSDYLIKDGDLVKLDLGLRYKGFCVDAAITVGVGSISDAAKNLIRVTEEALMRGIAAAQPGNTLGDIGWAVEELTMKNGFSVVESLTGHGIGRDLHEEPWVMNVGRPGQGEPLVPGMVIAIEPMLSAGSSKVRQGKDDSYLTKDGSLSAHFEHTVAITEHGPEVLTTLH